MKPAKTMTDAELSTALSAVEKQWADLCNDPDFEGHSGSPGEWMHERMDELDTEIKRRALVTP